MADYQSLKFEYDKQVVFELSFDSPGKAYSPQGKNYQLWPWGIRHDGVMKKIYCSKTLREKIESTGAKKGDTVSVLKTKVDDGEGEYTKWLVEKTERAQPTGGKGNGQRYTPEEIIAFDCKDARSQAVSIVCARMMQPGMMVADTEDGDSPKGLTYEDVLGRVNVLAEMLYGGYRNMYKRKLEQMKGKSAPKPEPEPEHLSEEEIIGDEEPAEDGPGEVPF